MLKFLWFTLFGFTGFLAATVAAGAVGGKVPILVHAGSSVLRFDVEISDTAQERSQGLMFRETLAPNEGMLFLYPAAKPVSFWMKNTPLPLDMIFIGDDGRIVHVAAMARPFDETPVSSGLPAWAVLEIPGGSAGQLGIRVGDHVEWPQQPTAPQP